MRRRRIVIIGAGSAVFTQGLVADLILTGRPWHLSLVDIDAGALAAAAGLSRRMVQEREADIAIDASQDRRELLPGADAVVTTIGVGGRRAWEADVFIPRRYGIFQPVGDTVMPGGISRALRMVPAMVDIARDVMAICPCCCLLQLCQSNDGQLLGHPACHRRQRRRLVPWRDACRA